VTREPGEQTPDEFEQLVLDVLHAIGYGGGVPTQVPNSGRVAMRGLTASSERTS
jgi:restriction endonuclease Mrr